MCFRRVTNSMNTYLNDRKGKNMEQNRFKSKVLWASLAAQVLSILVLLEVINISQSEVINQVLASLLQLGVIYGVLNNPTDKDNF